MDIYCYSQAATAGYLGIAEVIQLLSIILTHHIPLARKSKDVAKLGRGETFSDGSLEGVPCWRELFQMHGRENQSGRVRTLIETRSGLVSRWMWRHWRFIEGEWSSKNLN
ncbi:uncharacterized protein BO95DRAFT_32041 [Aspergillus brunneoviolaceus CBS 621.78]|uniref:Uncharacterized protein n=1 Tax=Aspergillus brunneoviolaceus CBS 621.78 TaxID=1450534 RepID=A0ACD1FSW3_9EURO|nr:hypothetical protein BO95DRAFT_32041 [Aspergillus brunneoviolaceus CBS 621.78]RAH40021.1 hypothetical protein BO95DRAFT_32041 [Aspergillus brunneoviolaceus CBS 621.78]